MGHCNPRGKIRRSLSTLKYLVRNDATTRPFQTYHSVTSSIFANGDDYSFCRWWVKVGSYRIPWRCEREVILTDGQIGKDVY